MSEEGKSSDKYTTDLKQRSKSKSLLTSYKRSLAAEKSNDDGVVLNAMQCIKTGKFKGSINNIEREVFDCPEELSLDMVNIDHAG